MDQAEHAALMEQLAAADARHHLHPFTDPGLMDRALPFVIDRAEGAYIEGSGVRLFDAMSGLGCVNIGYGHPEMAEAAKAAVQGVSYYHAFAATTTPPPAELATLIADRMPEGFNRVFFANSGSEANETILKYIRQYWINKGQPQRRKLISRHLAYHGSTMATTALNGRPEMWEAFGLDTSDILHLEAPFWYRNGGDLSADEYGLRAAKAMEEAILRECPETIAAIFCEPIQGTGGAIIPPETYLPAISKIARDHGILLVADEVLTGMGRAGAWSAADDMGMTPDMITLAKGLSSAYAPIAAAVLHDHVIDVLKEKPSVFQHGFTTGAHPVTASLAIANLQIVTREGYIERTRDHIGPYFKRRMTALEAHPLVGEVRCRGLICGIEIAKNQRTREQFPIEMGVDERVGQALLFKGVIVRPVGNTIVLCPPFIMTEAEADYVGKAVLEALDEVYTQLKSDGAL